VMPPLFGPNFAERLDATRELQDNMLPLLKRCLAGQFSLKYTEHVRRGIELLCDEIRENPVQDVEA
jgi:hypothetical protein